MLLKLSKILNDINSVLLPQVCFGCNARLNRGEPTLCAVCRDHLPLTDFNYTEDNMVDQIFYGKIPVEKAASFLFFYENGIVKELLHYLKYRKQEKVGIFLGEWYGQLLAQEGALQHIDVVVPVPLHPKKLRKRGYNQVALFGQCLAKHLNAEFVGDGLIRTANTTTQTFKGRLERLMGKQDLFRPKDLVRLRGKSILLVDDVITTGATMEACGRALLEIPETKLYIGSMAVVP